MAARDLRAFWLGRSKIGWFFTAFRYSTSPYVHQRLKSFASTSNTSAYLQIRSPRLALFSVEGKHHFPAALFLSHFSLLAAPIKSRYPVPFWLVFESLPIQTMAHPLQQESGDSDRDSQRSTFFVPRKTATWPDASPPYRETNSFRLRLAQNSAATLFHLGQRIWQGGVKRK